MGVLLSTVIRVAGLLDRGAFERHARHPGQAQKEFLLRLLKRNQISQYGKKYSFSSISSERDFRSHLPVVEYADIESSIGQIKMGVRNVLTTDPVFMFNMTSGTTAGPKYIPVTRRSQKRAGRLMRLWLSHALSGHPAMFEQSILSITGSAMEGSCSSGIPYGSASGMIDHALPAILRRSFATPASVSEIADYDFRYYVLGRLAYGKRISFIATPNPLTLISLAKTAIARQEEVIRSIHNGWLSNLLQSETNCIKAGIPASLISSLKPDRKRAAFLEKMVERSGRLLPVDCWPELKLVGCWLGGSIGFYTGAIVQYYGKVALRDIGYMASEGCITLPVEDSVPAGILALENNYYEFILESQIDSTHPEILTACELEAGKCYKILLTNENGLYRYDLNDIVKVDGLFHRTPVISFLRKTGNFLNIAGEKLHLNHCLSAIDKLQSDFSIEIHQFRIAPDPANQRYEFFFDIRSVVPDKFLHEVLVVALDEALCAANIEYDSRRNSKRLNFPRIHIMDSMWEADVRKEHARFRQHDAQYKWLPLSADKTEVDSRHINYTIELKGGHL